VSWVLAFLGFAALVLLHELGHFTAAKAVGMRVERFAVFFPPLIAKVRRGETEYGIGSIPLGGYVRITGMNPTEEIPPEVAHRAYYRQPVWKRIVVIGAGPAVNIALAFLILWALYLAQGYQGGPAIVGPVEKGTPAGAVLQSGDAVLAVDGVKPPGRFLNDQLDWIGERINASRGKPITLTVRRHGETITVSGTPFHDTKLKPARYRLGFGYQGGTQHDVGPVTAAGLAVSEMYAVTSRTLSAIVHIFVPEDRKQISSVVGGYDTTRQAIDRSSTLGIEILALISLSLGVINLFPFLPLDGGHIFWALAEKFRGRPVSFVTMERAGFIGFALVICLFLVGLSNDIDRIANGGGGFR
jgi:regulator of sigma E protease